MNFIKNIFSSAYEELWKAVIRPNRDIYEDKDLGPEKFSLKKKWYKRTDFTIINKRNYKLACSFWEPFDEEREHPRLPCVIYLHGNSSSRCEVIPEVKYLLLRNITVFAFDFTGCGRSEGEYISLGWHEQEDVECVINYLRKSNKVSTIGLWGRSMGAVTALMYGSKDLSIAGLVLDSPFSSLKILIDELARERVNLPNFIINQALKLIKEIIKEKANFNMDDIEPINYAGKCFIPAYFCHAKGDTFVNIHHCKDLYNLYAGDKNIVYVKGNHNTERPIHFKDSVVLFFYKALRCNSLKEKRANKSFINVGKCDNILFKSITNIDKNKNLPKKKKNNSVKEIRINLKRKNGKANNNNNKNRIVKNNKNNLIKSDEDVIINLDDNISIKNIVECPKMKTNSNYIKYINDINNSNINDTVRLNDKSFDYSIPNKTPIIHEINDETLSKKDIVNKTQNEQDEEIIQKILQLSKKEFEDISTNAPLFMINNNIHSKLFKKSTLSLKKNSIYNIPKCSSNKNSISLVKKKSPNVNITNITIPAKSKPNILLSKSNYENDKAINQKQNLNLSTKVISSKKFNDKNKVKTIFKPVTNKNFNNLVFRDIKSNKKQIESKAPLTKSFANNFIKSTTTEISFPNLMLQIRKTTKNENKKEKKQNNPKTFDNISIHHIYNLKNKNNFILKDNSIEEHKNMMINKNRELLEKVIASPLNNQNQGNINRMKNVKYTNITDNTSYNNIIIDKNLKKSEISLENENETINNSNFYNKINSSLSYFDDDDNFFIEEDNIGINIPHS